MLNIIVKHHFEVGNTRIGVLNFVSNQWGPIHGQNLLNLTFQIVCIVTFFNKSRRKQRRLSNEITITCTITSKSDELPPGNVTKPWFVMATSQGDVGITVRRFEIVTQSKPFTFFPDLKIQKYYFFFTKTPGQLDIFGITIQFLYKGIKTKLITLLDHDKVVYVPFVTH